MPRSARISAESGIYHIMLRGINHQQIVEDDEDYRMFLRVIHSCKKVSKFKVIAYCLMGNHVHLMIKEGEESLEQIFKRVGVRFVIWYNLKYQRTGHLFQDRFRSEAVEDFRYLNTVIAYIHQNPIKAGLCKKLEEYRYSSYVEYLKQPYLVDMDYVNGLVDKETIISNSNTYIDVQCLELEEEKFHGVTDKQARDIITEVTGISNPSDFKNIDKDKREQLIIKLKSRRLTIRQICRLTGFTFYVVRKVFNQRDGSLIEK